MRTIETGEFPARRVKKMDIRGMRGENRLSCPVLDDVRVET